MKELTAAAVRGWLVERLAAAPTGSIGVAGDPTGCPLARYLGPPWLVSRRYVEDRTSGVHVPLPRWACGFVQRVDALPALGDRRRRLGPRLALTLLDDAVAEARLAKTRGRP